LNDDYIIFPLGDSAATIELGKLMNESLNKKVIGMQKWFQENRFTGLKDIIVAYSSLTIVYDPFVVATKYSISGTIYHWIERKLQHAYKESVVIKSNDNKVARIPVCYDSEFGMDLKNISAAKNLTTEEIIDLHISRTYRVYMVGFLPGFCYLGEIEPKLQMPRKEMPEQVKSGSVGIVSNQTGIYPLNSPGGWHIIGRTPIKLFVLKDEIPVKLIAGDQVEFYPISRDEFHVGKWDY
jgi:inhibitor of KinA